MSEMLEKKKKNGGDWSSQKHKSRKQWLWKLASLRSDKLMIKLVKGFCCMKQSPWSGVEALQKSESVHQEQGVYG